MSLLAHCYYYIQDYVNASDCYEQLSVLCPDQEQYKLHYAQSLYKCGLYQEAMRVSSQIESQSYQIKEIHPNTFNGLPNLKVIKFKLKD